MSATETLRAAIADRLLARPEFTNVDGLLRDTAPNALPQARVDADVASDWSTKDKPGRELRSVVTVRVARGQRMRLPMMVAAAEAVGTALSGAIGDWQVGSAVLVRSRSIDATDGTRIATIEHRIRVLHA